MDTYEAAIYALQWTQADDDVRRQPLWLTAVLLVAIAANTHVGDLRHQQQNQRQTPSAIQRP